ncbi:MAG: helix-turn-helix domain-containing protein [Actinophytocola sp.]|nr:helix-turn-helix domain-containing protein [Actinophytocola sp.]
MVLQSGLGSNEERSGGSTARRMILGTQLRRLREAAGISRSQAGYHIRGSESKISRLELGRVGFKERDVADLLTMYGIHDQHERAGFLDMAEQSNQPGWWQRYSDLMPHWLHDYVGLEESASRIQTFELQFVPGLLQTEDYARTIASQGKLGLASDAVERRIALRLQRQKILLRPTAPRLWAFVDEAALRRPIGGPAVMKKQLEALLEWTKLPHIALQLLAYERSGHAAEGAFTVLRFAEPELPDIVYIEHLTGALYLDKREENEPYGRAIDRLAIDAETPDRTRQALDKMRSEI